MNHSAQARSIPTNATVFNMAWPLAIKAVMLHGIVVIDAYLISSLGENALASMGLASAVAGMILAFLFAFSSATQIRIAQSFGTRELLRLKSGAVSGLAVNLTCACFGLIFVFAFADDVISALAHTPEIAARALDYLYILSFLFAAEAISQSIGSYFNGIGRTRIPLYSYLLSLPVNIVVSILLIHGYLGLPELGLVGAAIGSSVAASIRVVFLVAVFLRTQGEVLTQPGWQNGTLITALGRHVRFALPIAATFVSAGIANQVCMLLYANLAVTDFASMTLILPWIMVAGTIGMSWAQSTCIVMAQILGRREREDVLDQFLGNAWRGIFVAAALVACVYLTVCMSAEWLYSGLQPATTAALFAFIPILVLLPFPKCSNAICGNTLRAAGDTVYVMNLFIGSQWLFKVPATAALTLYFDASVFWVLAVLLLEELVKFPGFHLRIFAGRWKQRAVFTD